MKLARFGLTGFLTLALLLGAIPVGAVSQQDSAVTPERLADFEAEVESLRSVLQIPGLAVGIIERGELVWAEGFGYANRGGHSGHTCHPVPHRVGYQDLHRGPGDATGRGGSA